MLGSSCTFITSSDDYKKYFFSGIVPLLEANNQMIPELLLKKSKPSSSYCSNEWNDNILGNDNGVYNNSNNDDDFFNNTQENDDCWNNNKNDGW